MLPNNEEVKFLLRSSYKNVRLHSFISGILLLSGTLYAYLGAASESYLGFGLICTSLFLLLILYSKSFTNKSYYSVSPNSLLLKRGFSSRVIKIKDIQQLKIVTEEEAVKEWIAFQEKDIESHGALDRMDSFQAQRKMGKFISYCTVPLEFIGTATNSNSGESKQNLSREGLFVLLYSRKGALYLLSPKDARGFIVEIEKYQSEKKQLSSSNQ